MNDRPRRKSTLPPSLRDYELENVSHLRVCLEEPDIPGQAVIPATIDLQGGHGSDDAADIADVGHTATTDSGEVNVGLGQIDGPNVDVEFGSDDPVTCPNIPPVEIKGIVENSSSQVIFADLTTSEFYNWVNQCYCEIVFFHHNLFQVPSGKTGKAFVNELATWLQHFNTNSAANLVAIKVFMILPALLLQFKSHQQNLKPSSMLKS